ncbi:hypothetical protein H4Q26_004573 [Puccinia striiformis f. sp. tritici PST-130]|nr:hypothetical protein H4Q26_004573 [Puccinia striiformis f. sp. tritici PST-130]
MGGLISTSGSLGVCPNYAQVHFWENSNHSVDSYSYFPSTTSLADSHPYSFGAHHTPTNSNTWGLTLGSQAHFNLQPSGLSFEAARYCLSALCASSTQPSG